MKEDWYKERNKRTDSFSEISNTCYEVRIKIKVISDPSYYSTQVMLAVLTNILSRWCRNICIICPDTNALIPKGEKADMQLLESLKRTMQAIDPNGNFNFELSDNFKEDLVIFIGEPAENCPVPYVAVDSNGWIGSCAYNAYGKCKGEFNDKNPLGAAFAACLANAEVFRWANNIKAESYQKWYDLYAMTVSELSIINIIGFKSLNLGSVHIVGCGAIGSSFTYLLSLLDFTGELLFVDADASVELHNTSSSLLFKASHCDGTQKKTEICEKALENTGFQTQTFNDDYHHYQYDHRKKSNSADLILCFANDFNIWSTIQNLYPPVVYHATTSRSWGINIGRHLPLKDGCIMCTFQNLATSTFIPKCAAVDLPIKKEVQLDSSEEPHASILPFLSPAAAIVTLGEVIKLMLGKKGSENSVQFNMSTQTGDFLEDQQKAKNCDICKNQSESIYRTLPIKLDY